MNRTLSRRQFISSSSLAAAGALAPTILPSSVFGDLAPSKQLTAGFIGLGLQGTGRNLNGFLNIPNIRVLALCDCKMSQLTEAKRKVDKKYGNNDCTLHQDFREVIARDDLDIIVISTPDHWHVPMSLMSLAAGKHTFSEKPSLTITQGRALTEAAAKSGKVFQWGVEDRSLIKYWMMAGIARTGILGEVHSVRCGLPKKPLFNIEPAAPIPDDLDWNLWLGPAPMADYTQSVMHPQHWRQRTDYSGGSLTDWGAHLCDTAQIGIGMDESGPVEISGTSEVLGPESYVDVPYGYDIDFKYANGATIKAVNGTVSLRFEGSKGWIACEGWNGRFEASDMNLFRDKSYQTHENYWPRPKVEQQDFVDAIMTGSRPANHPEAGHRFATMLHLGHIACRKKKTVYWDPNNEVFQQDSNELMADKVYDREERDWQNG